MRHFSVAFRAVVVLAAVFSISAAGQQSPSVLLYPATSIDLPVEPVHAGQRPTLAAAAQRNDFPAFDAIFNESQAPAYAELHSFWQWSLTDPVGAFYGQDQYTRLTRRYRDYAAYIEDYRIIDSHGNAFYPSAETRRFLLQHAMNGVVVNAPVVLAEAPRVHAPVVQRAAQARVITAGRAPSPLVSRTSRTGGAPVLHKAAPVASITPLVQETAKPRTIAAAGAGTAATVVLREVPTSGAPVLHNGAQAAPVAAIPAQDSGMARGLALVIAGLIGIGMLTLMLRTPAETEEKDPIESMRIIKLQSKPPAAAKDPESHSSVA